MTMIAFQVCSVSRHQSVDTWTQKITYNTEKERVDDRSRGAEWEEVTLVLRGEKEPKIQVGGDYGPAVMHGPGPITIRILDPDFFGTYKVGQVVSLR
jgi:hypothetical protein